MEARYTKNAGAVFLLKYHVKWFPRDRRPVLDQAIQVRLKALLTVKASEWDIEIHVLDIMPDHVHLFVGANPTLSVADLVNRFKRFISRVFREEFPSLKSRLPTRWSRMYYAGTIGNVSDAVVRKYIEVQKGK